MKKLAVALTLLLLLSFGTTLAQQVAKVDRPMNIPSFVGYVQDEFIVKFKPNAGTMTLRQGPSGSVALGVGDFDAVAAAYSVDGLREQFPGSKTDPNGGEFSRYYVAKFNQGSLEEAMAAFRELPMVELVEPIAIHTVFATPNDGYYVNQWHLNRANDADVDAPEAWDIETGKTNIIVAIMDSGVRYYHKDLGGSAASSTTPTAADGNMWINWAEKNGSAGVDDDGNGYVDDWVGWDWVTGVTGCWSGEDCSTADNDPRDFNGHGTHCAGNVGAGNNNGYATCAPSGGWGNGALQTTGNGVKVMALRIGYSGSYLGQEVGYIRMDFAASAFYYAARNGAKIASCSWGSSNTSGLGVAIDTFLARGGLIFKAAGNDNTQTADYMCSRTDIISVAALDSNGCKADFSTYGTWIDISAPGTGIWSSYHDHANPTADYVAALDGTSMATPLTASVAALIWSKNPTWTAAQVKAQLLAAVDTISGLSCNSAYAGKLGSGRINAYKAVNTGTPCDVAASFVGSPTSGQIPLAVNFTDQSTGPITSWSWNFGDGGTSTAQNPSHTYTTAGTYTVALTVNSATCSNTMTRTNYITATAPTIAMHVSSITVAEEYVSRKYRGRATVTIVDANNNPVSGAVVTGFFNYPNTTPVSATTNTSGVATLYSALNKKTVNFCFEVTNVTKTGYTYNAAANVVTRACETGPVFSQGDLAVAAGNMPTSFELAQNHPNPFNPTTSISFSLPTSSSVTLNVYNVLGEKIRTLATGTYGAGTHTVEWNSTNDQGETVASGIYFYRLTAGTEVLTKKMLLMK